VINALRTFTVVKSTLTRDPSPPLFFSPHLLFTLSPSSSFGTATPNMMSVRFFSAEKEVKVPSMGDSITEGALIEWNKSECGCG
jgi:hypothetical protein